MEHRVRDLMHKGVITCQPETSIRDAARRMVDYDVSALVVVDESGHMIGLLSRTDLVKARIQDQEHWRELLVADLMIKDVVTVHTSDTLKHAGELMMAKRIHRVVVVEENGAHKNPVAILSITDVVRDMARLE